jgi:hypothetical protein
LKNIEIFEKHRKFCKNIEIFEKHRIFEKIQIFPRFPQQPNSQRIYYYFLHKPRAKIKKNVTVTLKFFLNHSVLKKGNFGHKSGELSISWELFSIISNNSN